MRKIISYLLAFVICLALPLSASAATAPESVNNANVDLLRQQIEEVNNYLADNAEPVDLKDQTVEYIIPLSDGSSAKYSLTLTHVQGYSVTIFDAKLGTWYFKNTIDLPLHGSVTVQTTVNITHVPTEMYDFIRFTAYDGTVSAVPLQFTSVTGSSATTTALIETLDYETTGYVGFDVAGVAANLYFTQEIAFVNNHDQNTKIQCGISYTI